MQLNKLSGFTKEDLENCRAFSAVVAQSNFDLKGNAIIRVAQLKNWFDGLYTKIDATLKQQVLDGAPKVKKIGKNGNK